MTPPLTVFTTFFDQVQYLDETIVSVLSQSFADFEFLIVNDGDPAVSDRIERRYHDPRIRIITQKRIGLPRSRQLGLELARGQYIALIDSDDFCEPARLEKQISFLRSHPDHVLVGSAIRFIDEASRTIGHRAYPEHDAEIKRRLLIYNCIAQPAVMARREALIAAGGYNEKFHWAEDYDLWLRLSRIGKFHNLPEELVAYRIQPQAGKHTMLKQALWDSTRLKIHALRHYGFHLTPQSALSIALHFALQPLPSSWIWSLFNRSVIRSRAAATTNAALH